jgi:hypothetical protein
VTGLEGVSSVSVSLPERASSSQESATGADLGFAAGFWEFLEESFRWESVSATSNILLDGLHYICVCCGDRGSYTGF